MFHVQRQTTLQHNNAQGLPVWVFWIGRTCPSSRILSWTRYKVVPTMDDIISRGCFKGQAFTDIPQKTIFNLLKAIGRYDELDVPH